MGASLVSRALRQLDRAFWCLRDHLSAFVTLGMPTLLALICETLLVVSFWRTFEADSGITFLFFALVAPVCLLFTITFFPLPCGVYTWFQAIGNPRTPGECLAYCFSRANRLLPVMLRLTFSYFLWFLFFGLPMLVYWPRGCLAPSVALFEEGRKVFVRARRLLKEDVVIYALSSLFLLLGLALGGLIPIPRLLLMSEVLENDWTRFLSEWIWVFEITTAILLISGMAICWTVALTFVYHDIRFRREGERIRQKVQVLMDRYAPAGGEA
ncbi:MAG TPA: hypothetical protein VNQ76_12040 [Planctomicrobium sp.]|nr:hypothetical protein [Planctomicrobium sp.]